MRVTQSMITANTLRYSQASYERLTTLQDQLSTQKKITRFSQDPIIATKSMKHRDTLDLINQYKRNINEAHTRLDQSGSSLTETTNILSRIHELTVKAATDSYTEEERKNIADEVGQLREHLLTVANANIAGKYVFNNPNNQSPPVRELNPDEMTEADLTDRVTISFNGALFKHIDGNQFENSEGEAIVFANGTFTFNDNDVSADDMLIIERHFDNQAFEIELQEGVSVPVSADAHRLFTEELFHDLFTLEKALNNPSTEGKQLGQYIESISSHLRTAADVNGQLGARMNRVDLIEDRLGQQDFLTKKIKSENEDVDFEETVMKLLVAETIHSAALAASARVLQPSLLDFLR